MHHVVEFIVTFKLTTHVYWHRAPCVSRKFFHKIIHRSRTILSKIRIAIMLLNIYRKDNTVRQLYAVRFQRYFFSQARRMRITASTLSTPTMCSSKHSLYLRSSLIMLLLGPLP